MVQLRYPQVSGVQVDSRERRDKHQSPNHTDRPCDGCNTWGWCGRHSCCWRLERRDIAAERQQRNQVNRVANTRKGGTPI